MDPRKNYKDKSAPKLPTLPEQRRAESVGDGDTRQLVIVDCSSCEDGLGKTTAKHRDRSAAATKTHDVANDYAKIASTETAADNVSSKVKKRLSGVNAEGRLTGSHRPDVNDECDDDDISELLDSALQLLEKDRNQKQSDDTELSSSSFEKPLELMIKEILTDDDDLLEKYKSCQIQNKGVIQKDIGLYVVRLDKIEESVEWRKVPLGISAQKPIHKSSVDILHLSRGSSRRDEEGTEASSLYRLRNVSPESEISHRNVSDEAIRNRTQIPRPKTRRGCPRGNKEAHVPENNNRIDDISGDRLQPITTEDQDVKPSTQSKHTQSHEQRAMSQPHLNKRKASDIHDGQHQTPVKRKRFIHFVQDNWIKFKKKIKSVNCFTYSFSSC